MAGIVIFKRKNLDLIRNFYLSNIGMELWLDQKDCVIMQHGNLLLGFCDRDTIEQQGMITFFFRSRESEENFGNIERTLCRDGDAAGLSLENTRSSIKI